MDFAVTTNLIAFVLWAAVYFISLLCFIIKRNRLIVALFCGIMTVTAIIYTLVLGANMLEIGFELAVLLFICLVARGIFE